MQGCVIHVSTSFNALSENLVDIVCILKAAGTVEASAVLFMQCSVAQIVSTST